jgi:hypothetical protein
MSPLKGSQGDHWRGKIPWKYHFQAKPDIILQKITWGSFMNPLGDVL